MLMKLALEPQWEAKFENNTSKDSVMNHKNALRKILREHRAAPLEALITRLSSTIGGWTRYHSVTQSTKYFSFVDKWLFWSLWKWAVKRYKTAKNAKKKCFSVRGWNFGFRSEGKTYTLARHDATKVRKYFKIKAGASIYSGEIMYFAERMSMNNARIKRLIGLMKSQQFSCSHCKQKFMPWDLIELHHVLDNKKVRTGKIEFQHKHCHDTVHSAPKIKE